MKTIKVKEFKDLSLGQQQEAIDKTIEARIEYSLNALEYAFTNHKMSESEYYKELGCSKDYAEGTSWFVPSCYYEKHKERINAEVMRNLKKKVFTTHGEIIDMIV